MKYYCEYCNYSTNDHTNFRKHKKSKKHNIKSNEGSIDSRQTPVGLAKTPIFFEICEKSQKSLKKLECKYCKVQFSKSCNLTRHLRICSERRDKNNYFSLKKDYELLKTEAQLMKERINSLEMEKTYLEKEKLHLKSKCNILETENDFHKQLINVAGGMIQKSMNTMSYLLVNYNDAPKLEPLSDYSIISDSTETLIKDLVFYQNKGTIDKYFGNFIIKQYKKKDPKLQALWTSDTERLNYFIRELIKNTNDDDKDLNNADNDNKNTIKWTMDKKGIKVSEYVIEPLLDYIYKIGIEYTNSQNKKISNMKSEEACKILKNMESIGSLINNIKNKTLINEINKYIAPYFYLNKEEKIKMY